MYVFTILLFLFYHYLGLNHFLFNLAQVHQHQPPLTEICLVHVLNHLDRVVQSIVLVFIQILGDKENKMTVNN